MNDASAMSRIQRVCDLNGSWEAVRVSHFERLPRESRCFEGRSVQELHDDERKAIVLADVVNCADIRMVQRRSGKSLAAETIERFGIS